MGCERRHKYYDQGFLDGLEEAARAMKDVELNQGRE